MQKYLLIQGIVMRNSPCHNLIDFHLKDYNILFGPTNVVLSSGRNNLHAFLQRNIGSHSFFNRAVTAFQNTDKESLRTSNPSLSYFINKNGLNGSLLEISNHFLNSYSVYSIADRACHFFILGAIHRCIQIVSISLHNKVQVSHMNPYMKFFCTTAIAVIPLIAMSWLGYSAMELACAAVLRTASSYFFPTKLGSKIREMDLISDRKDLSFNNLKFKNFLSFTRNLTTTFLIDFLVPSTGYNIDLIRNKSSLGVCVINNTLSFFGQGAHTMPVYFASMLFTEIGWSLGRLLVDCSVGLLRKCNLIDDLRDPFYRYSIAAKPAKKRVRIEHKEIIKPVELELPTNDRPFLHELVSGTPSAKRRIKKQSPIQAGEEAPEEQSKEVARVVEQIPVEGFADQPLLPFRLNRDISESVVYGVLANQKTPHFEKFSTALSNTEYIGKDKGVEAITAHQGVYAVRIRGSDERLLGKLVEGEQEVYETFSKVYGYERALGALEQMKANNLPPRAIIFSKATDHSKLNKDAQQMAIGL